MKIKIKKIVILFLLLAIVNTVLSINKVFADNPVTASGDNDYMINDNCIETYYHLNKYLEGKSDRKNNDKFARTPESYYRDDRKVDTSEAYYTEKSFNTVEENKKLACGYDSAHPAEENWENAIKRNFQYPAVFLSEGNGVETQVFQKVIYANGEESKFVQIKENEIITLNVGDKLQLIVFVKYNWYSYKVDYLTAVKNGNTTVVAQFPYKPDDIETNGSFKDDYRTFEYIATKDTNNKSVAVGFEVYTHDNRSVSNNLKVKRVLCRNFFKVQVEVQENAYQDIKKFIDGDKTKKQHLMNEISSNGIYNTIVTDNAKSAYKNSKILKKSHPVLYKLSLIDGGRDILYQWYHKCRINAENFLYMSTDEINEYISKKGNLSKDDKIELNKKKHAKTSYDVINILLNRRARKRNKFRS